MKPKIFLLILGISIVLFSANLFASVPRMISYQGKITTTAGLLIDTTLAMTFAIYADPLGMPPSLWGETQDSVKVEKGLFSVLLGSVNPISDSVFDGSIVYLAVKVGDDPVMTPLKPIVSVAYAYRALNVDNDWTFRITDTADTTLITGGQWGMARYGNVLYGNGDSTHVNLGVACTTGLSGQNYKYCTVGGGRANKASGASATVVGGSRNIASQDNAIVGGGENNTASGWCTTIGGGAENIASNSHATVAGGWRNAARGDNATVSGGWQNTASGYHATLGGGAENTASGDFATVAGGWYNIASSYGATVEGGTYNTSNNDWATVGGGCSNTASGLRATVLGGYADAAAGDYSIAAGEAVRVASIAHYTFAFGRSFTTSTPHAVIFCDSLSGMKVGIQTTSPTNILTVQQNSATDPVADAWTTYSSKEYKRDIHEFTPEEYREALEKVVSVPVVKFHYKGNDKKEKIGVIAEDAPKEILAEGDNKAISLNEYISLLHAALKAQQERIEALEGKLEKLEANR
jgi:hypothetical protein